jgi:hypothetical protein
MEDEVVLAEPAGVGLDEGGGDALQTLAEDGLDAGGEIDVPDPSAGETNETVPVAGERNFQEKADDAVVVILDLAGQPFAGIEDEGIGGDDNGRSRVTDIGWGGMLEVGLLDGAAVDDPLELVEADLLADIELDKDTDGPDQAGL